MGEVLAVKSFVLAVLAALTLASCGSDKGATGNFTEIRKALTPKFGKATAAATPAPEVTRAAVEAAGAPALRASIPSRGAVAFLGVRATKGDIITWQTTDRTSVVLQRGMVLETRGLGDELMSARVPPAALVASGTGSFQREYYYLDGADQDIRWDYDCTFATTGRETIEIIGLAYDTRLVTETCRGAEGRITNQYWVESGGKIRQSVQWISKGVGYMKLESVIE
jgi:Group 4 capsule polysaccharide lipoprotein gfcB, YjbF